MPRKALSKKTRFDVFKRDGFACQYCGSTPPKVVLQVDHIIPVAGGGGNSIDNLITSCQSCNIGKGAKSLSSIPESLKDKALRIKEQEEQIKEYSKIIKAKEERLESSAWNVAHVYTDHFHKDGVILKTQFRSIKKFVDLLGEDDCLYAMEKSVSVKPWSEVQSFKYFCGICWNKIKDEQK